MSPPLPDRATGDATVAQAPSGPQTWRHDVHRLGHFAAPLLVGQLAVLGFSTIDTLLVARASAEDLAALAVASAAYITVFIGLMGTLMAISPIVGRLRGAGQDLDCGRQLRQGLWLAMGFTVPGAGLLLWPEPFIALSHASPDIVWRMRAYLIALAVALPASLVFAVMRGFSTAVGQPKMVMRLQLTGLAVKAPLSAALVFGVDVPAIGLHLAPLGVLGCGIATAVAMWSQTLIAAWRLRRDATFARYGIQHGGLGRPDWPLIRQHLRLGVPMGLSILIEVTGFSFMALFISRLGSTAVAGHQITANLVSLMFMLPLALANAGGALVAQQIGARDGPQARALGWHVLGLAAVTSGVLAVGVALGRDMILRAYTHDASVMRAAAPLLAWAALFHAFDALQTVAAFVLRAWHVATAPMVIYAVSLWGVGLGGGFYLTMPGGVPSVMGPAGFWIASTAGLGLAASALIVWLVRVHARSAALG